jgi:hypothetical protein
MISVCYVYLRGFNEFEFGLDRTEMGEKPTKNRGLGGEFMVTKDGFQAVQKLN